jgi:hypothetical protein
MEFGFLIEIFIAIISRFKHKVQKKEALNE